jgi:hypothetical protein
MTILKKNTWFTNSSYFQMLYSQFQTHRFIIQAFDLIKYFDESMDDLELTLWLFVVEDFHIIIFLINQHLSYINYNHQKGLNLFF